MWDDTGGCKHEWGEHTRKGYSKGQGYENLTKWNNNDGPPKEIPHITAVKSQFCQKCNAWRGSLGLEPTPELYIQHIVQVFGEVRRVLRKDGTCWLNIGDTYHGGGCGNYGSGISNTHGQHLTNVRNRIQLSGLKPKDLCMIPARVALALQADGWWLRSDIIWSKPNPMPESVTDRPTTAHEHVFLLAKSQKYFYDNEAVREKHRDINRPNGFKGKNGVGLRHDNQAWSTGTVSLDKHREYNPAGRNIRSVWPIATEPTPEAHFATFPSKLCEIAIKAGTSQKGCCSECGANWERVMEKTKYNPPKAEIGKRFVDESRGDKDRKLSGKDYNEQVQSKTSGWKETCKCYMKEPLEIIPCTVLDPFSGSGKALIVAKKLGRTAIGIDLKVDYLKMPLKKLAQERLI